MAKKKKTIKKTVKKTIKKPLKKKISKKTIKKKVKKPVNKKIIKKPVKKPVKKRISVPLRSISEELFAPNIGDFLSVKGGAYRYRITTMKGEKIITRSLKTFLFLVNEEVQKINDIKEKIKKKMKLTGTYGRIFPPTTRNERKDGTISSINVDFSGHPLKDINKNTYDQYKKKSK